MNLVVLAGMTFVSVVGLVLAVWWAFASGQAIRSRLAPQGETTVRGIPTILRTESIPTFEVLDQVIHRLPGGQQLKQLTERAGMAGRSREIVGGAILLAGLGALIAFSRLHDIPWAIACGILGAALPVIYLRVRAHKRIEKFSEQFPDALDMVLRSLRAGYAVGPAIQLVADEMPDPVGREFKVVSEEIFLGRPLPEALQGLCNRIDTEDVHFFYTAVTIQRDVGGNLAEIIERLSEVIRERYRILSYARVLSTQQKGTAYIVGLSPFVLALLASLLSPGWLDPLWRLQHGKLIILGALVWQVIGFLVIKRIANIKV